LQQLAFSGIFEKRKSILTCTSGGLCAMKRRDEMQVCAALLVVSAGLFVASLIWLSREFRNAPVRDDWD
jgi:hypothetical protein